MRAPVLLCRKHSDLVHRVESLLVHRTIWRRRVRRCRLTSFLLLQHDGGLCLFGAQIFAAGLGIGFLL